MEQKENNKRISRKCQSQYQIWAASYDEIDEISFTKLNNIFREGEKH